MKLREIKELIEEGQTAMLYSPDYLHNCHVYKEGDSEYMWADVDANGNLLSRSAYRNWYTILAHLPESASSLWEAR